MIRGPVVSAVLVLVAVLVAAMGCSEPDAEIPAVEPAAQEMPAEAVELVLSVEGMVCQGCANEAANAAAAIEGVVEARGVFEDGTVVVHFIRTATTPAEIARAISATDRGGAPDFVATIP